MLFAFPFKRRFINDEQQPFPEGRAAGVVMDSLHHGEAAAGLLKAKLLIGFGSLAAVVKLLPERSDHGLVPVSRRIPEFLDEWLYQLCWATPTILGTPVTSSPCGPSWICR